MDINMDHYLGEEVKAVTSDGRKIEGKITFIRIEIYNPGGGLKDVFKYYYTIVGAGVKEKVREYEIVKEEPIHINRFLQNRNM